MCLSNNVAERALRGVALGRKARSFCSSDRGGERAVLPGAIMVFSFSRVGAALAMHVEDVFVQNWRLWVRMREKGGKRHKMP